MNCMLERKKKTLGKVLGEELLGTKGLRESSLAGSGLGWKHLGTQAGTSKHSPAPCFLQMVRVLTCTAATCSTRWVAPGTQICPGAAPPLPAEDLPPPPLPPSTWEELPKDKPGSPKKPGLPTQAVL